MRLLRVTIAVGNPFHPEREQGVELLVDTGANYSMVPSSVLGALGIEPLERETFLLANGEAIERDVGLAWFVFDGRKGISKVIFGGDGDTPVLGVVALEEMGLEVDPFNRKLRPAKKYLLSAGRKAAEPIQVTCPHCNTKLEIDTELAAVLSHEPPPAPKHDFDEQLKEVTEAERKRDEVFRQQVDAQKERARLLERKFEESFKKTKDQPVTKPLRDFDLE